MTAALLRHVPSHVLQGTHDAGDGRTLHIVGLAEVFRFRIGYRLPTRLSQTIFVCSDSGGVRITYAPKAMWTRSDINLTPSGFLRSV